tara:strand:+ start:563 stop:1045 length:483 start_codon:yes stop_codon:yes gene_type:complete
MKIIAHRGNRDGKNGSRENSLESIMTCIENNYDVEIDIRYIGSEFYLGHDNGQYKVNIEDLLRVADYLWVHCKNIESLEELSKGNYKGLFNYFWHEKDDYTLTSKGYIWCYPGAKLSPSSIYVMPEWVINRNDFNNLKALEIEGICTDYPDILRSMLNSP